MRPVVKFLSDELIEHIISEAKEVLCQLGMEIHNRNILSMLEDHGAKVEIDRYHALLTDEIIDLNRKCIHIIK